jgi:hypothetical protein
VARPEGLDPAVVWLDLNNQAEVLAWLDLRLSENKS